MKKWISYGMLCLLIPAVVIGGAVLFRDRQYAWISLCVTALACVPFFLHFEKSATDAKRLILIAVMTSLSVLGRILFTPIPGFKPVTAMVVITAMYFGGEAGFLTGALSAVISNFYFGQGPWTPFQMFAWGLIGLIAGALQRPLKKSRALLIGYGLLSGVAFSFLMDVWTVLWAGNGFQPAAYAAALATALPHTVLYALSNGFFLLIFARPMGEKLDRITTKYEI